LLPGARETMKILSEGRKTKHVTHSAVTVHLPVILKIKASSFSKMLVNNYQSTQHYMPEDEILMLQVSGPISQILL
jgi:hypothetical protein